MAEIIPFPRVRDRRFVRRHASWFASCSESAGERYLAQQLKVQAETMAKRGIAADRAMPHLAALETAIRAAAWQMMDTGGVA